MLQRVPWIAAVSAILSFGTVASSQQTPPVPIAKGTLQQRLQEKFVELHKAGTFPGGTAGFVLEDGTSFGIAVGVSDRAAGTPMKPTDRLLLGSVGKTYVSAVALQMMHEKKFGLDDTLDRFFGREPWFARIANGSVAAVARSAKLTTSRPAAFSAFT